MTKIIGSAALAPGGDSGTDLTTKGDLHGYSSSNTRVPIGDDDQVLTADSAQALGLKWATASGVSLSDNNTWTGTNIFNSFLSSTPTELTISSGVVTATRMCHQIDTEGDQATDNLTHINGYDEGRLLSLQSASSARDPTLLDEQGGAGTMNMAGDFTLTNYTDTITFIGRYSDGVTWAEISRSNNG